MSRNTLDSAKESLSRLPISDLMIITALLDAMEATRDNPAAVDHDALIIRAITTALGELPGHRSYEKSPPESHREDAQSV